MSSQWLTLIFIIVLISRYDYIGFSFTIIKIKLTWQTLRRTEWSIFLLRTGNHVKEVRLPSGDWKWLSHKSSRLLQPLRFANWPLSKQSSWRVNFLLTTWPMFGRSELSIRLGDVIGCFHYFLQQGPWFWKCLLDSEKTSRKFRQKVSTNTKVRDHGNKNWSKSSKSRAVYLFFI